jgi:hypothetical protein
MSTVPTPTPPGYRTTNFPVGFQVAHSGALAPEGVVAAPVGRTYLKVETSAEAGDEQLWIKARGNSVTGWLRIYGWVLLACLGILAASSSCGAQEPRFGRESAFTQQLKTNTTAADWRSALGIVGTLDIADYWTANQTDQAIQAAPFVSDVLGGSNVTVSRVGSVVTVNAEGGPEADPIWLASPLATNNAFALTNLQAANIVGLDAFGGGNFMADGAVEMTGPLKMGGNAITNAGSLSVTGAVTAASFAGDGSSLTNLPSGGDASQWATNPATATVQMEGFGITNAGSLSVTGTVTAASFVGDGSGLTGLDGTSLLGALTNDTTGNAATATLSSYVAGALTNAVTNVTALRGYDLTNAGPSNGQILKFDGTGWALASEGDASLWSTYVAVSNVDVGLKDLNHVQNLYAQNGYFLAGLWTPQITASNTVTAPEGIFSSRVLVADTNIISGAGVLLHGAGITNGEVTADTFTASLLRTESFLAVTDTTNFVILSDFALGGYDPVDQPDGVYTWDGGNYVHSTPDFWRLEPDTIYPDGPVEVWKLWKFVEETWQQGAGLCYADDFPAGPWRENGSPWGALTNGSGAWGQVGVGISEGVVTAESFVGDGSGLTGLPASLTNITDTAGGAEITGTLTVGTNRVSNAGSVINGVGVTNRVLSFGASADNRITTNSLGPLVLGNDRLWIDSSGNIRIASGRTLHLNGVSASPSLQHINNELLITGVIRHNTNAIFAGSVTASNSIILPAAATMPTVAGTSIALWNSNGVLFAVGASFTNQIAPPP